MTSLGGEVTCRDEVTQNFNSNAIHDIFRRKYKPFYNQKKITMSFCSKHSALLVSSHIYNLL